MRMRVAQGWLALGLLAGCRSARPTLDWDVIPEVAMESEGEIALDPREDRILLAPGRHPVDPSIYRGMVMSDLIQKGYRSVAPEQAKLWVSVHALAEGEGSAARAGQPVSGKLCIIVEFFQPRRDQPCWRGTLELPSPKSGDPATSDPAALLVRLLEPIGHAKAG